MMLLLFILIIEKVPRLTAKDYTFDPTAAELSWNHKESLLFLSIIAYKNLHIKRPVPQIPALQLLLPILLPFSGSILIGVS